MDVIILCDDRSVSQNFTWLAPVIINNLEKIIYDNAGNKRFSMLLYENIHQLFYEFEGRGSLLVNIANDLKTRLVLKVDGKSYMGSAYAVLSGFQQNKEYEQLKNDLNTLATKIEMMTKIIVSEP